jgi:glycerol-3-phosphate dehydrogenase subunit B
VRFDAIVVGAGTAGLVAAARLGEAGRRVAVVAKGAGSIRLAPGTIDVLGYGPDRVEHPANEWAGFVARNPDHPYGKVPLAVLAEAVEWLRSRVETYRYVGSLEENQFLPTAIGAAKPSAVVPETMAAGDLRAGGSLLLCGLRRFKDFYPALAADNLAGAAKVEVRAVELDPPTGEADVRSLAMARLFETTEFRRAVVRDVLASLEGEDAVGFPAVLGLARVREVWTALQDELGRHVFEIPTPPPSVPGLRLASALEAAARRAGVRVMIGSEVVASRTAGRRVEAVAIQTAARQTEIAADSFVLASGGFLADGIDMTYDGVVRERVLGLPVAGVPGPDERLFSPTYLDHHPLARAGLAVDDRLRPVDQDGAVVFENVFAAGAVIGGAEPWKEKSGEGISLGTGFLAAREVLDGLDG